MIQRLLLLLPLLLLWVSMPVNAETLRPFDVNSMTKIEEHYSGQPYIVVLWSITCPPCIQELEMLGKWQKKHRDIPLVLIATDSPEESDMVLATLVELELKGADNWLFADAYVEKLRFAIDPGWHGELPRSYLYSPDASRRAISGALTMTTLRQWHQATTTHRPLND